MNRGFSLIFIIVVVVSLAVPAFIYADYQIAQEQQPELPEDIIPTDVDLLGMVNVESMAVNTSVEYPTIPITNRFNYTIVLVVLIDPIGMPISIFSYTFQNLTTTLEPYETFYPTLQINTINGTEPFKVLIYGVKKQ